LRTVVVAFVGIVATCLAAPAISQWQPNRNIEIIAPAAAGSALDSVSRLLQRILQEKRLTSASITVVNKTGGGNAVGFTYLASHAGDAHYVAVTPLTIITNRIMGANRVSYQDVTPIAMLADEHIAFVVKPNSPMKTGRDLLDRLKKDPTSVSMALAAALGNANHIAMSLVGKAVGADPKRFKIAVFNSSGESITAVLGGHVDLAITTSGLLGPHVQAGRLAVLAVAADRRLAGPLAQVPTWKEQGVDVTFSSWRALIGPGAMTPPQVRYWEALVSKVAAQDEWMHDLDNNGLTPIYMNSDATRRLFTQQEEQLRMILTELGLAK
jgi:putative tricarboxylic transport membrane protein